MKSQSEKLEQQLTSPTLDRDSGQVVIDLYVWFKFVKVRCKAQVRSELNDAQVSKSVGHDYYHFKSS
jgi:hypothetical protein